MLAVLVSVSIVACGGSEDTGGDSAATDPDAPAQEQAGGQKAATPSDLAGRTFTATEARGAELTDDASLELTFTETRLGVDAGCNEIGGNYSLRGGEIQAFLASTLKGCPPEETELEVFVSELLRQGAAASLNGDTLFIDGKNATTLTLVE